MNKKIVITAALPYANGTIHIGHLLEYIQTDIFARFLKLLGKDALYICASDMHGTPIEINAKKAGVSPEKFVDKYWKEHQKDFASFLIKFDNYYKTHSKENKELAEYFYTTLKKQKLIYRKKIPIIYCTTCKRSLPDRFVKGTCPHCKKEDQYGDVCESCSSILKGIDLLEPYCTICKTTPKHKESEHYFFKLSSFTKEIQAWMNDKEANIQPEIKNWLNNWIEKGLEDWCVSRDAPYFGFEIPNSKKETGEKKYFYVWLDAPIGYISSTKNYCGKKNKDWRSYWYKGQVYQFLGKDIAYFHYLFWPAMLMGVGIPLPQLTTHGFVNINNQKMSKSRGTFFTAKDFLKLYPAEALRFYYGSHLDRKIVDINFNQDEFIAVNNNVLVGNLGNFCYRVLNFAQKKHPWIKEISANKTLTKKVHKKTIIIEQAYADQDFKKAVKYILQIADLGNAYFQKIEPWKNSQSKQAEVAWCVNLARNLAILVQPILPEFHQKIASTFSAKKLLWNDINFTWTGKLKNTPKLVEKIEKQKEHEKLLFPLRLQAGQITSVKEHPNADSLYLLKVNFKTETRQVVAGLKKHFTKKQLLNKKAVFCTNLKPAKLRGEMSEAMILVAEDKKKLVLLEPTLTVGKLITLKDYPSNTEQITFNQFLKVKFRIKSGKIFFAEKQLLGVTVDIKDGAKVC